MAASAKPLFRAIAGRPGAPSLSALGPLPERLPPLSDRDPLDFDPTPWDATAAFLAVEARHIRLHSDLVWEPAVGAGHMAKCLIDHGFRVAGSDIVGRGWSRAVLRSFYDFTASDAPSRVIVTNPPYSEVNARDGHGRWLRHALACDADYVALLLNADWPAARINGFDQLLQDHPPSIEWLCCWKIDFRGGGSPPQRNSWFVWDRRRPPSAPAQWIRARLYRDATPEQQQELAL